MVFPRRIAREGDMVEVNSRVSRAVIEGREARSAYYRVIGLQDEQWLGPPASETQLARLEERLSRRLPPSYRSFLLLHNGWRMFSGTMDLLTIEEIIEGPRRDKIKRWQRDRMEAGDLVASNALVIGWAELNLTKTLLDPFTM